jgi:(p)ppGpp synthase/HD superfamily hydrolase
MNIAYEAMLFAKEAHKNHLRKYTNEPYFDHLSQVAGIAASVLIGKAEKYYFSGLPSYIAIAWLHDCIEDCGVTFEELENKFSPGIANGVLALSDLEEGNRETRKRLSRERLSKCEGNIQTIKVADLISNTNSIVKYDPKFADVYLHEKHLLLEVLTKADAGLLEIARQQCYSTGIN